jgi:HAD superfamily hydrolase (TIGR01484 family)
MLISKLKQLLWFSIDNAVHLLLLSHSMIIEHDTLMPARQHKTAPKGLFVTDLDGTLLRSDRTFAETDLNALKKLGDLHITRVIATGRSLFSFNTVADSRLPVDYVLFSTGAGVTRFPEGKLVRSVSLEEGQVKRAMQVLTEARLDFMIHDPIPENHRFAYVAYNAGNTDFDQRISLYQPYAYPLQNSADGFGPSTQLLAVLPPSQNTAILDDIRKKLSEFNVIQTTSPLDGKSTWIEIFPASVSKSITAQWLAEKLEIDPQNIVSLGNDYNDEDLLEWSQARYVVENAPQDLKERFPVVASNNDGGVAECVERWLSKRG